jgi:FtsH-binding integral membrane protein
LAQPETPPETTLPGSQIPGGLRVAALLLRTVFIGTLILIVLSVSMPQNEMIWTIYDTPLDVIRLLLGLVVCLWLVVQLFKGPSDAAGYRTWLYLGIVAVPFALITLVYVWFG